MSIKLDKLIKRQKQKYSNNKKKPPKFQSL